jgi:hypothetical protein
VDPAVHAAKAAGETRHALETYTQGPGDLDMRITSLEWMEPLGELLLTVIIVPWPWIAFIRRSRTSTLADS